MAYKKPDDISGQTFGYFTAISRHKRAGNHAYWTCRCICGTVRCVRGDALRRGDAKSCGCARSENAYATHRLSGTPTYKTWQCMKSRCHNPNDLGYHNYGGRGIAVCDEWRTSFDAFYRDMGERPDRHSLERVDNNGPYSIHNCKWATAKTQARNRRTSHFLTHNGETKTIIEWAESAGLTHRIITMRLRAKWPIHRILTTPKMAPAFRRA